jgi:hypothetical protein
MANYLMIINAEILFSPLETKSQISHNENYNPHKMQKTTLLGAASVGYPPKAFGVNQRKTD